MNKKGFISILLIIISTYAVANNFETSFQRKASIILNQTADGYKPPSLSVGDPEKYYYPIAIARYEKYGLKDSIANHYVDILAPNNPFHFTFIGMARLLGKYGNALTLIKNKDLILQKVFDRTDSYNAWTGEGTENHVNMSRTSGYLFAEHAVADAKKFPDAQLQMNEMAKWMAYWSKKIFETGTGEWNSSTYLAYNLIGWLNIYDFAKDETIRDQAKAVLDYYATELAIHYSFGSIGGSEMRGGKTSFHTATSYLGWLWFGNEDDYYATPNALSGSQYIQCVHAATSSYRPPVSLQKIAKKNLEQPVYFKNSQPAYLLEKKSLVKQFFYADHDFTLGSSCSPYGGFTGATSQIVNWKLVVRPNKGERPTEISGNGLFYEGYPISGRDPFTQYVQHENVLIQLTNVPKNSEEILQKVKKIVNQWSIDWKNNFEKRFPQEKHKTNVVNLRQNVADENKSFIVIPESAKTEIIQNVLFVDAGNAFLAVRAISKEKPELERQKGLVYIIDEAPKGTTCGFVVEAGSKSQNKDFSSFKNKIAENLNALTKKSNSISYINLKNDKIEASYQFIGTFSEAISDWGYGVDQPTPFITSPPFVQPEWPIGEGYGKIPLVKINNKKIDYEAEWPIWESHFINMSKSILEIKNGKERYILNYQSEHPVWQINGNL